MSSQQHLTVDSTAATVICIQGSLDERWSQRLGGLAIQATSQPDQAQVTMLSGELQDQAALVGVLNTLYDLGLPLLSVEWLDLLSTAEQRNRWCRDIFGSRVAENIPCQEENSW